MYHLQIHGKKSWTLKPPPECYWSCNYGGEISTIMEPGMYFAHTFSGGFFIIGLMWFILHVCAVTFVSKANCEIVTIMEPGMYRKTSNRAHFQ